LSASNPSKFLRLDDRGEISVGRRADFAVIDLHSPETVRNTDIRSRCGWSPYEGREFPGRIRWTISKGELLVDEFEPVT
jgi:dihydroorotase